MTPELPEGLKVWFEYTATRRSPKGRRLSSRATEPWRRCVIAHVVDAETREEVSRGMAVCNPVDQFVRKVGRTKALGRALGELARTGR
jgi:transposase InsO family protein